MRHLPLAICLIFACGTASANFAKNNPAANLAIQAFRESSEFLTWQNQEKPSCPAHPSKSVGFESIQISIFNGKISGSESFLIIASNGSCPGVFEQFYRRLGAVVTVDIYDNDVPDFKPNVKSISFPDLDQL